MSDHEIPSETSLQTSDQAPETGAPLTPDAAPTTSEHARVARSAPERRDLLCPAADLLRFHGHDHAGKVLLALVAYVDELEVRAMKGGAS